MIISLQKIYVFNPHTRTRSISYRDNVESTEIIGIQVFWDVVLCSWASGSRCIEKYVKSKGKVVPVHTIKSYRASGGTAPLIPNLGTRWRKGK